ncbi:MAG: sulfite exporter TauE/SafE family protein [Promethearchaeota archaeon]|nr:MAG: sulfite exporter TauE/SafE family protein [Candidatus Lokiarchaeota archaeon]
MIDQFIKEFDIYLLIIVLILGFIGGLFDNSFGMGYGLLTPIFIILGFNLLVIVPTLLLAQAMTGFSGTIFHSLNKNIDFRSRKNRETKIYFLFTITGIIGTVLAVIFAVTFSELFMLIYIGSMMIVVGFIVLLKIRLNGSWHSLYVISIIAGFNKAISGGGYGPLVTNGQLMSGSEVRESVGVTQFSESTISIIGFLLYFILNDFIQIMLTIQLAIIMVLSGMFSAPIGAIIARYLSEKIARTTVAWLSITLGIITLLRILLI